MSDDSQDKLQNLAALSEEAIRTELEARARPASAGPKGLFAISDDPGFDGIDTETLVKALRHKQSVVYGVDDRKDYYEIDSMGAKANAESVVALFDAGEVIDQGDGTSRLGVETFKTVYQLCDGETFAEQPCGAFCSGVLIAPDVVASAGHCVDPWYLSRVARIRFVFGFRLTARESPIVVIPNSSIYSGKEIIHHRLTRNATDWSLIRLDRPVINAAVVKLRTKGIIEANTGVYVIGHPCGLPLKYAPGAHVTNNSAKTFFTANLDTYGGNSGSPVFNANDEVEGLLVRGETDFVRRGKCRVSLVIPTSGAGGEDVTRISEVRPFIPKS
jgi:hypothetical protein